MMSIDLAERLESSRDKSTVVTYFFCQNDNYEINTIAAIIKGLILRLVKQKKELMDSLRCHWEPKNERFSKDVTSWQALWEIFLEMLVHCECQRIYIIVDALDECQDNDMADFLKSLVRTGLDAPSRVKWLLTSRPLDSAERELLSGTDQLLVSLELNSSHVSKAVKTYVATKVDDLDRRHGYGETLRRKVETELTEKSEGTYLWVSLVCQELEGVSSDKALSTIQDLPLGLYSLYHRALRQVGEGGSATAKKCMRLLKVMMLAYRPLNVAEVGSVTGLSDQVAAIEELVNRSASFIKRRGADVEFVHQSARDYLAGQTGQHILDSYETYGHGEIALNCLSHLTERLKVNLANLTRPDSTRQSMRINALTPSVGYAVTFWVQHLEIAKQSTLIQDALSERGEVSAFLLSKLLEWLECLSLLDKLPHGIKSLKILADAANVRYIPPAGSLLS